MSPLAALLISGLSLYLSSLKSAEIEVDHVSSQLDGSTFSGELPQGNAARFTVFVSNGGARGGLLHKIWVDSLEWLGEGEPFWADLHQTNIFREVALMTPLLLPAAYEAGDAETATLVVTLIPAPVDVEELAARLGETDGIAHDSLDIPSDEWASRGLEVPS